MHSYFMQQGNQLPCCIKWQVSLLHKMIKKFVYNLLALALLYSVTMYLLSKREIWKFGKVYSICSARKKLPIDVQCGEIFWTPWRLIDVPGVWGISNNHECLRSFVKCSSQKIKLQDEDLASVIHTFDIFSLSTWYISNLFIWISPGKLVKE